MKTHLLLVLVLLGAITACSRDHQSRDRQGASCSHLRRTPSSKPHCCDQTNSEPRTLDTGLSPLTDRSIYQLESVWTNDASKPFRLAELRGRPQVLVMFFASCAYACPILVNDLKRIEAALPDHIRSQVGFVLVSFDTERDTPMALAAYRQRQHLPVARWTLLHGRPDDVLELAALLAVKYKRDASGQFSHSNILTVLNPEGEIVHQHIGLNQDLNETIATVQRLAGQSWQATATAQQ